MSTPALSPTETRPDKIAQAIRNLQAGRSNATGSFTLTANATTTTVTAPNCAPTSTVNWSPTTANAANDMATTSAVAGNGQFVVTHANNARTDRTFSYAVVG